MTDQDHAVYEFLGRLESVLTCDWLTDSEKLKEARQNLADLYEALGWDAGALRRLISAQTPEASQTSKGGERVTTEPTKKRPACWNRRSARWFGTTRRLRFPSWCRTQSCYHG